MSLRSAYLLHLPAGDVSSCLELMRRLLQPRSRSLPHVTVRYTANMLQHADVDDMYEGLKVDDLTIAEPTTFDAFGSTQTHLETLVFRCESESIEHLSYRPQYADSFFHLTVYDGPPARDPRLALEILRHQLEGRVLDITGTAEISRKRPSVPRILVGERWTYLSDDTRDFAREEFGLDASLILNLAQRDRMSAFERVTERLLASSNAMPYTEPPTTARIMRAEAPALATTASQFHQPSFWHESEIPGRRSRFEEQQMGRATGTVLTPPEIALDMATEGVRLHPDGPILFGDPAVGTGILYAAIKHVAGDARIQSALGFERDPGRARATARRWRRGHLDVVVHDFLDRGTQNGAERSLVLANPPYLRYEKQEREELRVIAARLRSDLSLAPLARSNLFVYFVLSSHLWMAPNAVAVWLLPAEFMATHYGQVVRDYFATQVTLRSVHVYSDVERQFDNARVVPTLVAFQNAPPPQSTSIRFSFGSRANRPQRIRVVDRRDLSSAATWDRFVPRKEASTTPSSPAGIELGELFHVRRGLATGGNGFFVLSESQREALAVPDRWVRPVLPKARFIGSNVIEADVLGNPVLPRFDWLIDSAEPIDLLKYEAPRFADYLRDVPDAIANGFLARRRRHLFKQENVPPPMFVFVSMARTARSETGGRFIRNESRSVALNNYHVLYPNETTRLRLASGSTSPNDLHEALRAISLEQYEYAGRRHASALVKVEPGALRSIRVTIRGFGKDGE